MEASVTESNIERVARPLLVSLSFPFVSGQANDDKNGAARSISMGYAMGMMGSSLAFLGLACESPIEERPEMSLPNANS